MYKALLLSKNVIIQTQLLKEFPHNIEDNEIRFVFKIAVLKYSLRQAQTI